MMTGARVLDKSGYTCSALGKKHGTLLPPSLGDMRWCGDVDEEFHMMHAWTDLSSWTEF
jgi:hypothetical protein